MELEEGVNVASNMRLYVPVSKRLPQCSKNADPDTRLLSYRVCTIPADMQVRDGYLLQWLQKESPRLHSIITGNQEYRSLKLWTRRDGINNYISMWAPGSDLPTKEFKVLKAKKEEEYMPMLLSQTEAFIFTSDTIREMLSGPPLHLIPRFTSTGDSHISWALKVTESQLEYQICQPSIFNTPTKFVTCEHVLQLLEAAAKGTNDALRGPCKRAVDELKSVLKESKVRAGYHSRGGGYPWITIQVKDAGVWHLHVMSVEGSACGRGTNPVKWGRDYLIVIDLER